MNKDLIVKSISFFGFMGYDMPEKENIISPFSQFILHTHSRGRVHTHNVTSQIEICSQNQFYLTITQYL